MTSRPLYAISAIFFLSTVSAQTSASCDGKPFPLPSTEQFTQRGYVLSDNTLVLWARSSVNVDGMKRAYHKDNIDGGGLINLCNGGRPYPVGEAPYSGTRPKTNCSRFNKDYKVIRAAGWKSEQVGAIKWFGVLGKDTATITGKDPKTGAAKMYNVPQVVPVEQADGSGFFVSPTHLEDYINYPDPKDQHRYLDAETVPFAVTPSTPEVRRIGVKKGTFGIAYNRISGKAVPFIVGDSNSVIGESSFAMGRELRGLPMKKATRANIYEGHIDTPDVLWVFFSDKQGVWHSPPIPVTRCGQLRNPPMCGGVTRTD